MPIPKKPTPKPKSTFTGRFTNKEKTKVTWDLKKPKIKGNTAEWKNL